MALPKSKIVNFLLNPLVIVANIWNFVTGGLAGMSATITVRLSFKN